MRTPSTSYAFVRYCKKIRAVLSDLAMLRGKAARCSGRRRERERARREEFISALQARGEGESMSSDDEKEEGGKRGGRMAFTDEVSGVDLVIVAPDGAAALLCHLVVCGKVDGLRKPQNYLVPRTDSKSELLHPLGFVFFCVYY